MWSLNNKARETSHVTNKVISPDTCAQLTYSQLITVLGRGRKRKNNNPSWFVLSLFSNFSLVSYKCICNHITNKISYMKTANSLSLFFFSSLASILWQSNSKRYVACQLFLHIYHLSHNLYVIERYSFSQWPQWKFWESLRR